MKRCAAHDLLNCKCREPFADYIARRDRESDDVRVVGVVSVGSRAHWVRDHRRGLGVLGERKSGVDGGQG